MLIPLLFKGKDKTATQFSKEGFQSFLGREREHGNPLARSNDDAVRKRVARHLTKGKIGKAVTALLSSGVAKDKKLAERIMRHMHPDSKHKFDMPGDLGRGLQATDEQVSKVIRREIHRDGASMGFAGWRCDLLLPVIGVSSIMTPLTQLIRRITNVRVPKQMFWLSSTGLLIALNKLTEDLQEERMSRGLDPKKAQTGK